MIAYTSTSTFYARAKHPVVPGFKVDAVTKLISSGSSETVVDGDAVFTRNTSATVDNNSQIIDDGFYSTDFESLTPSVASVSVTGLVSRLSDGTARIIAKTGPNKQGFNIPVSRTVGAIVDELDHWVDGSLAKYCSSAIDSRLTGKPATPETLNRYTVADHIAGGYVINPNAWFAEYHQAMTGVSPWNPKWGQAGCGTAITPRHVVGAKHYNAWMDVGQSIRFVTVAGQVINRTVIAVMNVGITDIQIALLDSDLPESITPIQILPADFEERFKNLRFGVPCLPRNQFGEGRVFDWFYQSPTAMAYNFQTNALRQPFNRTLVIGDSGGASMLMINGGLVLVTTWSSPGGGPAYHTPNWSSIIATVDSYAGISTGLLPSICDLTGFTIFS